MVNYLKNIIVSFLKTLQTLGYFLPSWRDWPVLILLAVLYGFTRRFIEVIHSEITLSEKYSRKLQHFVIIRSIAKDSTV